jgi:hypothetical protein
MPITAEVVPFVIIMAAANKSAEPVNLRGKPVTQQLLIVSSSDKEEAA